MIKKILLLVALPILVCLLFVSGVYEVFQAPIQLALLKAFLVSFGFAHAYLIINVFLPKLDLSNDENWQRLVMEVLIYLVVIYCYAMGG